VPIQAEFEHGEPTVDWFEELVRQVEVPVYQLTVVLCSDPELARELVQEAFLRAWQSPKTPHNYVEFRPWLYKIVVNLLRDHYRREHRLHQPLFVGEPTGDPVTEAEWNERKQDLAQAVATLSTREREVIYLRFFDDTSYREVARVLGLPEIALRVLLHRALRKLRRKLQSNEAQRLEIG
jgi:RNA polymerase sigma-70 factor, ECF subfamily